MELTFSTWELEITKTWTESKLKNYIWLAVECKQPIPGCISVDAMRVELIKRGLELTGYHNT